MHAYRHASVGMHVCHVGVVLQAARFRYYTTMNRLASHANLSMESGAGVVSA